MSSKDQDVEAQADERPQDREKVRRSKSERKERSHRDRDHDRERDKDPERRRHRTSRLSKSKLGSELSDNLSHTSSRRHRHRKDRDSDEHHRRHHRTASTSDLGSSDIRTSTAATSILSDRINMPYPSFSKAHSKEAIVSRDSLSLKPPTREPPEPPTAEELKARRGLAMPIRMRHPVLPQPTWTRTRLL
ncbi:hypothetical protein NXS19_005698 [Fusarium pseudograminearum]|nr:hypothetical protein NXS19_005698 [Fusarium pseudograminearum]